MLRRILSVLMVLLSVGIVSVILIGVADSSASAQTLPNLGWTEGAVNTQPSNIPVVTNGNLEVSPVFLDGKPVGTIASFVELSFQENDNPANSYSSATRSYLLHSKLQKILDNMVRYSREVLAPKGMTIDEQTRAMERQLTLTVDKIDTTTVVLIKFPEDDVPEIMYSVTQADIERPRFGGSQPSVIANSATQTIKAELIQAWSERQLPHLHQQCQRVILVFVILVSASLGLVVLQRYLASQARVLHQQLVESENDHLQEISSLASSNNAGEKAFQALRENRLQILKLNLRQKKSFNALYRSGLFWAQWLLWLLGIGYLTSLLYWSRPLSNWIIGVSIPGYWSTQFLTGYPPLDWFISFGQKATLGAPLMIILLLLGAQMTLKIGDVFSDWQMHQWSRDKSSSRHALRAPTLGKALKSWLRVLAYLVLGVAIAHQLYLLGTVTQMFAVMLGFLSFALSLASQDLLKDLISGVLILWEDQFVVGDVIFIGGQGGLVENITLRVTQLRNLDGELITIPNRLIATVRNLSSEWAQVNYAVEVGYDADVDKALEIIEAIAQELYQDSEWQKLILEAPEILGIDSIAHTGTLIRLLIKTQPLQQWAVGREFRRRLKKAFDQHGIDIGVPKQHMYLQPIEKLIGEDNDSLSNKSSKFN